MYEAKKERRQVFRGPNLAVSSVLLSTILLAGCSSAGSSLNPLDWFGGSSSPSDRSASAKENPPDDSDFPKIRNDKRPEVSSTKERSDLTKGLAADHSNAKYTQDVLRREGNPTRPLSAEAAVAPKDDGAASSSPATAATAPSPLFVKPPVTASAASPAITTPAAASALDVLDPPPEPAPAPKPDESSVVPPVAAPAPAPASTAAPAAAVVPAKPAVVVDDTPPPPPPRLPPTVSAPPPDKSIVVAPEPAAVEKTPSPVATAEVPASASAPVPAPVQTAVSEVGASAPAASAAPLATASAAVVTAPAPVAAPVATASAQPAPASVDDVFRRRLAEFSSGTVSSALTAPSVAKPAAPAAEAAPGTVLLSPAEYRRALSHDNGGARTLEAFDGSHSAASFQVAAVRFGEGTAELSAEELAHLKDVAALYREKGGSVRVLGRSASPRLDIDAKANLLANRQLAGGRAAAIARQLIKLGIPARKIYAGAVPSTAAATASNGETTEIYIDY